MPSLRRNPPVRPRWTRDARPVRCTPSEMHACEVHRQEVHAHQVRAHEMHAHEMHVQ